MAVAQLLLPVPGEGDAVGDVELRIGVQTSQFLDGPHAEAVAQRTPGAGHEAPPEGVVRGARPDRQARQERDKDAGHFRERVSRRRGCGTIIYAGIVVSGFGAKVKTLLDNCVASFRAEIPCERSFTGGAPDGSGVGRGRCFDGGESLRVLRVLVKIVRQSFRCFRWGAFSLWKSNNSKCAFCFFSQKLHCITRFLLIILKIED